MSLSPWNSEDLVKLKQLDTFLSKKATWQINTAEVVQLYQTLVWVAQLEKKIDASIAEIVKVTEYKKAEEPTE